ncbi:MAG: carboxypeptidase regulatory-like domain-containing protein [Acidobacteria bacterium]|nr:MAG: carboxypeptidase regulatory-like domain-containing protein [Acidobacteriota bacterium]
MLNKFLFLLMLVTFGYASTSAQTTFSLTTSPYTQNFDGLANTGNNTWMNGANPPASPGAGWQSNRTSYAASDGSSNTGALYSFGSVGSTERALGSLASNSTSTIIYGICFTNNAGFTITSINVNYTGEQWRQTALNNDVLVFEYRVGVNDVTASGAWTNVPALNFTPPQSGSNLPLDGNAAANRVNLSSSITLSVPPGADFCLRWSDADSTGSDKGMAIDDFQMSFTTTSAAPASIMGRVIDSAGRGISNAFVTLTGGSLTTPIVRRTNTFGYYSFEDIPVGETYIISVSSKRHNFSQSTHVVTLQENISNLDFIADDE